MKTGFVFSFRASFFGAACVLTLAAPFFAGGCGGDETTPPPGSAPIPIESIRKEFEAARCEALVRCGSMPDAATCLAVSGSDQNVLQLLADVVYGTVVYDEAAARSCVNALKGASCDGLSSSLNAVTSACEGAFQGSVPEGGGCVTDQECQGKGRCDKNMCMGNGPCCIGVCVPEVPLVGLGGDCSMPESFCVPQAYCDNSGQGGGAPTCATRNDNGQKCNQVDACLEGQRCDTNGDNTCYKLSAEGQQCNPTIATGSCLRVDNWCDTTEKKCVKLPGAGQPCADVNGSLKCLDYAYCDEMAMTCKSKPREGEACMQGGPECLGALYCGQDPMTMMDVCLSPPPASVCVLEVEKK